MSGRECLHMSSAKTKFLNNTIFFVNDDILATPKNQKNDRHINVLLQINQQTPELFEMKRRHND